MIHNLNHYSPSWMGSQNRDNFFTDQLRLALSFCNLNLHSFRIGAATTAAARVFPNFKSNTWGDGSQLRLKRIFVFPPYNYETSAVCDSVSEHNLT